MENKNNNLFDTIIIGAGAAGLTSDYPSEKKRINQVVFILKPSTIEKDN